jgi:hypothetical protein
MLTIMRRLEAIDLSCPAALLRLHWRPAEVADALRVRTREPRILHNRDGVEVLKSPRTGEEPLATAL